MNFADDSIAATGTASVRATSWTDMTGAIAAIIVAIAAAATFVVAFLALKAAKAQIGAARDQLDEARRLRVEQAQPYVVAFMEPNKTTPRIIELVVRNFGTTAARSVRLVSTPPLQRTTGTGGGIQDVRLPAAIPFLAPGQVVRTLWDTSYERNAVKMPDRYDMVITYLDSADHEHSTLSVLDWGVFRQRMWINEHTIHHAAEALQAIQKTLTGMSAEGTVHRVVTYDGETYDAKLEQEAADIDARLAAIYLSNSKDATDEQS